MKPRLYRCHDGSVLTHCVCVRVCVCVPSQALARLRYLLSDEHVPSSAVLVLAPTAAAARRLEAQADAHWLPFGVIDVEFLSVHEWARRVASQLQSYSGATPSAPDSGGSEAHTDATHVVAGSGNEGAVSGMLPAQIRALNHTEALSLLLRHVVSMPLDSHGNPLARTSMCGALLSTFNELQDAGVLPGEAGLDGCGFEDAYSQWHAIKRGAGVVEWSELPAMVAAAVSAAAPDVRRCVAGDVQHVIVDDATELGAGAVSLLMAVFGDLPGLFLTADDTHVRGLWPLLRSACDVLLCATACV